MKRRKKCNRGILSTKNFFNDGDETQLIFFFYYYYYNAGRSYKHLRIVIVINFKIEVLFFRKKS